MSTISPSQGLCPSPRGHSPSATFRGRQRAATNHPIYSFQGSRNRYPSDAASTTAVHQRRSPPLAGQTIPDQIRCATSPHTNRDGSPEPPSSLVHSANQQNFLQMTSQRTHSRIQSDILQHKASLNQMTPALGFARLTSPTARDQAHSMLAGTSGMAYAGGASSGPISGSTQLEPSSLPKESTPGRTSREERPSLHGPGLGGGPAGPGVQRRNTTSRYNDHETWELSRNGYPGSDPPQRIPAQQPPPKLEVQPADSLRYLPSLSAPSDHSASYNFGDRELRSAQAAALPPSPPAPRLKVPYTQPWHSTLPSIAQPVAQSLIGQSVTARIPDKSLPIQEEPDSDDAYEQSANQEQTRDRWSPFRDEDGPSIQRQEQEVHDPRRQQPEHAVSPPTPPSEPVLSYLGHPHSPMATHTRPSAPIPPTPHGHTPAPTPSPVVSGMGSANSRKPVLPPNILTSCAGSPYPYPFTHIRRGSSAGSHNRITRRSQMEPQTVHGHLALQTHTYALMHGGTLSDSTLSPSSTPFPGPEYIPWKSLETSNAFGGRRGGIADSTESMHSSPSQQPVSLPPFRQRHRRSLRSGRSQDLRRRSETRLPRRVESTQPRDTSSELPSGEETASDVKVRKHQSEPCYQPPSWDESAANEDGTAADDGEWVDEDVGIGGVANDLLQLEFHTDYVSDPEKRHQRWKLRWEALLREFHALDRETDTTLVLLAAPFHTDKLHFVASRAVRRNSSLLKSTDMMNVRSAFAEVASQRRATRPASLLEQLSRAFSSSSDGPSSSSDTREKSLRCALDTAIGGLHTLGSLYEQREMRWIEEKHRLDEDKDKVQLLLKQVLGVDVLGNLVNRAL